MAVIAPKIVVTLAGRNYFANFISNKIITSGITQFKIGVGGYTVVGGVKVPKEPSEDKIQLEAEELGYFTFTKAFDAADLIVDGRTLLCKAVVLEPEANDDGTGASPELFEIGLFSDTNILIAYATHPMIVKVSAIKVTYNITLRF